uniref:Uncharacterized protein n=1 Tax=Anguilla anguilla TaxID=7936 RepID=A0A0E9TUT6_ANGAN
MLKNGCSVHYRSKIFRLQCEIIIAVLFK